MTSEMLRGMQEMFIFWIMYNNNGTKYGSGSTFTHFGEKKEIILYVLAEKMDIYYISLQVWYYCVFKSL